MLNARRYSNASVLNARRYSNASVLNARRSQSWSIDIVLGVLIFIIAFFIVYALLGSSPNTKAGELKQGASAVVKQVASQEELNKLEGMSYEELKSKFKVEGDFCMYLEDDKGNLIPIGSKKGIGSGGITIGGSPCG